MQTKKQFLSILTLSTILLFSNSASAMQFLFGCLGSQEKNTNSTIYKTGMQVFNSITAMMQNYRNDQLFTALQRNEPQDIVAALAQGAQINARDKQGKTPFIVAIEKGNPNVVKFLIQQKADINQVVSPNAKRCAQMAPLMFAMEKADTSQPNDPYTDIFLHLVKNPHIKLNIRDGIGRDLEYWAKNKPALLSILKQYKAPQKTKSSQAQAQSYKKPQRRLSTIQPVVIG